MSGLATVAATAPFVGMLGNVVGIVDSFVGFDGEKTAIMAAHAGRLSDSILPTACGLGIAVIALAGYQCLCVTLTRFDSEMRCAILQLSADLRRGRS